MPAALALLAAKLPAGAAVARLADAETLLERTLRHDDKLSLGWPELEAALPDGALPRGVIEIASPRAHGTTRFALSVVRAAQEKSAEAWCAWLDPDATLFAPGVAQSEVDLARLLVLRPSRAELGRIAVKVVGSGAFDVVVLDDALSHAPARTSASRRPVPPELLVRKLAVAAEPSGARVLLLTDGSAPRAATYPVAMRVELEPGPTAMRVRVAKDRRGRVGLARAVPWESRPLKEAL
jgi:RecA/RadA recombinase